MTGQSGSQQILARLESKANDFDKPQVRLASIQRLKSACDAIAEERLGPNVKINPSNVEKYVRMRHKAGSVDWTGPTRVFISSDGDLRAYVAAREDERRKPVDLRKRPSQRQRDIEDAVSSIAGVEIRQVVRYELEDGRLARRRLELLSKGLRTLPAIDVDALLRGDPHPSTASEVAPSAAEMGNVPAARSRDAEVVAALLERFGDAAEMARMGLECVGMRLRMSTAPRTALIRPDEMAALRRFAGVVLMPAADPSKADHSPSGTEAEPMQRGLRPNNLGVA